MSAFRVTSPPKRRGRPKGAQPETIAFRESLLQIIEQVGPPLTVRQIDYLAVSRRVVPKSKEGYSKISRNLSAMRENWIDDNHDDVAIPFDWIADNTRWMTTPEMWDSPQDALDDMVRLYRRNFWRDQPVRTEVWVESDSIRSFVAPITEKYGVSLMATRGQSSSSFLYQTARHATRVGKPVVALYFGDWDPSGVQIDLAVQRKLTRYGDVPVIVMRKAVTPDLIRDLNLPGHTLNLKDTNVDSFVRLCAEHELDPVPVETEAIDPNVLRQMVEDAILGAILDVPAWNAMAAYEDAERRQLESLVARFHGGAE